MKKPCFASETNDSTVQGVVLPVSTICSVPTVVTTVAVRFLRGAVAGGNETGLDASPVLVQAQLTEPRGTAVLDGAADEALGVIDPEMDPFDGDPPVELDPQATSRGVARAAMTTARRMRAS